MIRKLGLLLFVVVATGCAAPAQFSVLRPAMLNARQFGGTISVAGFDGHPLAAAAISEDLRQRIVSAEGQPIALVEGNGALVIHGSVLGYTYSENISRTQSTCSRSVTVNGQTSTVQVPCVRVTRQGNAHVAVAFNITVAQTGQTVYSNTFEDSDAATRTATDATPAHINGDAMLSNMRAALTEQFGRVILPWRETVRVAFGRCGDAQGFCDTGIVAVRGGDFPSAINSFQQAITFLEGQPEVDNRDLSEAYWNMGLAREYSGDYPGAVQALVRAIELNGNNQRFPAELQNVQRMAEEAQRLSEQGVAQ